MSGAAVERRMSAIMVADIVGYSRLIEADETATLAAVRALRETLIEPSVTTHRGRIVKLMGDGILAEFGSVVDCVLAAVAIQQELAEPEPEATPERFLVLRIGLNLGDVVVEGDDVLGDAVNIAARLEQLCEPGGVLVSGAVYDHMQGRISLPIDYVGEKHMRNIERGIRAYSIRIDGSQPAASALHRWTRPLRQGRSGIIAIAVVGSLILIAAGAAYFWRSGTPPSISSPATSKPSIAVLPFDDFSNDAASERLAKGLTDDIITDLARYRDFDIIARNSVEPYRDRPVDAREIGTALNVRFVLEGSIQRQSDLIRVNAQLIETANGAHVWSDRWDRPIADVFAVQTEIAEHTASAIAGSDLLLSSMQASAHRKPPGDLEAYDLTVLAYESFLKGTEADTLKGIEYADQAILRDPGFARAYVQKAWLIQDLAKYRKNWNDASREMEELGRTAIRLDPYDANAHIMLAWTLGTLGKNDEALSETERALELNPSSADILNIAADTMSFLGKPQEGADMCDRSFRLNPAAPDWYYADCVTNLYFTGRYQEAIRAADRGSVATEPTPSLLVWKAASQAELGQDAAARKTIDQLKDLYWEVSFEWLLNTGWNFERVEEQDMILGSARKVGLRICASADEIAQFDSPRRLPECEAGGGG